MVSARKFLFGALGLFLCVLCELVFGSFDDSSLPSTSTLSGDEIVQKLVAANARRAERLRGYRGKRLYKLDYRGIFGGHAEMQVEATYFAPNEKQFKIVSESGSKLLIRRVLLKLLQSEHDAQEEQNRKALEISPANYAFTLDGIQHTPSGDFYILSVQPKSKSKFVYKGKIWVRQTSLWRACMVSQQRILLSGSVTLRSNINGHGLKDSGCPSTTIQSPMFDSGARPCSISTTRITRSPARTNPPHSRKAQMRRRLCQIPRLSAFSHINKGSLCPAGRGPFSYRYPRRTFGSP